MLTIQTVGIVARHWAHHFNRIRRKFRSQTSDSMKRQRRERDRREEIREEKGRRKKIKVREKVEKVAKHCVFQCFVAPEGRKVGSLKRQMRSHLGR